jgi:hypothetical protein
MFWTTESYSAPQDTLILPFHDLELEAYGNLFFFIHLAEYGIVRNITNPREILNYLLTKMKRYVRIIININEKC